MEASDAEVASAARGEPGRAVHVPGNPPASGARSRSNPVSLELVSVQARSTCDVVGVAVNPAGSDGATGGGGGGAPNTTLLDLMIQHGADVNTQVTGTRTYSMRISYNPPADKEGTSALHAAVQAGRTDMVLRPAALARAPESSDGPRQRA